MCCQRPSSPPRLADLGVARHRADRGVGERLDEHADGVRLEHGVAVDHDDQVVRAACDAGVERGRLARVRLPDDADAGQPERLDDRPPCRRSNRRRRRSPRRRMVAAASDRTAASIPAPRCTPARSRDRFQPRGRPARRRPARTCRRRRRRRATARSSAISARRTSSSHVTSGHDEVADADTAAISACRGRGRPCRPARRRAGEADGVADRREPSPRALSVGMSSSSAATVCAAVPAGVVHQQDLALGARRQWSCATIARRPGRASPRLSAVVSTVR